jgi:hypothetical protein
MVVGADMQMRRSIVLLMLGGQSKVRAEWKGLKRELLADRPKHFG